MTQACRGRCPITPRRSPLRSWMLAVTILGAPALAAAQTPRAAPAAAPAATPTATPSTASTAAPAATPTAAPTTAPVNKATGYSASALYDLANADARAGRNGLAVLNYERARLLDPADPDIDANLRYVRQGAGLPPETRSRFEQIAASVDSTLFFWIGVAGIAVIGAASLARRRHPSRRRTFGALRILGVLALGAAGCNAAALWPLMHRATVIVRSAPVHVSPVSLGDPLFTIPEAQAVTIRAERAGFVLVETPEGHVGWVAAGNVARLVP
ncbi:MAG TPA: hypothetical protein VHZ53_11920 [Steroidobacteraceae bacterium]|nr:hypothetical protein [Steroidobacteraceae bacterium]